MCIYQVLDRFKFSVCVVATYQNNPTLYYIHRSLIVKQLYYVCFKSILLDSREKIQTEFVVIRLYSVKKKKKRKNYNLACKRIISRQSLHIICNVPKNCYK